MRKPNLPCLMVSCQGGIMTGNLGTRFPRNLNLQPKYCVGVPLFDKICINVKVSEQFHIIDTAGELGLLRGF